jgi:kumamolisin
MAGQGLVRVEGAPDLTQLQPSLNRTVSVSSLRVGLALKNIDEAGSDAFVLSQYDPNSPNFHKWIDGEEFGRRFGAPDADVQALTAYLKAHGFTNITVSATKLFISADATVGNAEKAFNTKLANYDRPTYLTAKGEPPITFAPSTQITLPANLAAKVAAVHGLSDILVQHPSHTVKKVALTGEIEGYGPYGISTGYETDAVHSRGYLGQGMDIAVYSPTQWTKTDADTFAAQGTSVYKQFTYGYPITGYTIIDTPVDGGPTSNGGATEASLDVETIIGQAPHATVNLVEPSNSLTAEIDAYNKVLALKYPVLTSSWGIAEYGIIHAGLRSFATTFSDTIKSLAAAGISVFVASGDSGAFSKANYPAISSLMESACPWVTSVGGTDLQLVPLSRDWLSETAWIFNVQSVSGGSGGLSQLYARPTWQTGPGVSNSHSNGFRELPDVSANADPASGYAIYSTAEGGWAEIGGTSASTPLWASNILLIDQYLHGKCGLLDPALYTLGTDFENPLQDYSGAFYLYHDITIGNNGAVNCTADWDYCTGWGSANFQKLLVDLASYMKLSAYGPDLEAYDPYGALGFSAWTNPIMIHTSTSTVAEPTEFFSTDTLYFAVCMANLGSADAPYCYDAIEIDGVVKASIGFPALPANSFGSYNAAYSTKLAAGTHTITLLCNNGNRLHESNYANNTYTRTIIVH